MNKSIRAVALASALFAGALAARADDAAPATQAAAKHATTKPTVIRLDMPYSQLTDLSDDQKSQIFELHKSTLVAEKALRAKEEADIRAVLDDAQKAELDKLAAEKKGKAKEKQLEKKAAATEPAAG